MTSGGSSIPEVGRLLATLTASKPAGRIAEAGTAFGAGALAIVAALGRDATFVTVEADPARFEAAREALAGSRAEIVAGLWRDVLPARGPFDLFFLDAGIQDGGVELAISLLAPGGILLKDDLTPGRPIDDDPVRQALLRDSRLVSTEFLVSPEMAVIVAVRR